MDWWLLSAGLMMLVFWVGTTAVWAIKEWMERDMYQAPPPESRSGVENARTQSGSTSAATKSGVAGKKSLNRGA